MHLCTDMPEEHRMEFTLLWLDCYCEYVNLYGVASEAPIKVADRITNDMKCLWGCYDPEPIISHFRYLASWRKGERGLCPQFCFEIAKILLQIEARLTELCGEDQANDQMSIWPSIQEFRLGR